MNRRQRRAGAASGTVVATPHDREFEQATLLHQAGRLAEAEEQYRRILAVDSGHAGALGRLGRLALQAGGNEAAVELLQRALARDGRNAMVHDDLGLALAGQGKLDAAQAAHRRAAQLQPDWAGPHSNLAFLQRRTGAIAEAVRSFKKAVSIEPSAGNLVNLGLALEEAGAPDEARASFEKALVRDPHLAHAHLALANLLENTGDLAAALAHAERAVAASPDLAIAHLVLGIVLAGGSQLAAAEAAFRHALALRADYLEARTNLANVLHEQGRLEEALAERERVVAAAPDNVDGLMHAAGAQLYRVGGGLADIDRAARRCGEALVAQAAALAAPCIGSGDPQPRLGFLSADFRTHAAGILVLPTLEELRRRGRRVTCYSAGRRADALTARFRAAASSWRDVAGLPDAAVADRIRADRIDLLVDVSGYTAGNRALVLAARAAPVQLGWAAYPATTGLATMDYLLADRHQVPEASEPFYREAIIRLPHSYVCFEPPPDAPEPGPPPARAAGRVTFGSFNAAKKITPAVIAAWSRILRAVPDARLLIKATAFACPETRRRYGAAFAAEAVAPERLELVGGTGRAAHLAAMAGVDIVLDSFPYSGGVTTLEALWMGLPVVTLPGDSLASRHSLGYLATLGLAELAADSINSYVARAQDLAHDPDRLAQMRATLRARMLGSPLCDSAAFGAAFERACGAVWAIHRAGEAPRTVTIS